MKLSKQQLAIYMNKYANAFVKFYLAGSAGDVYEQREMRDDSTKEMQKIRNELWELINK